MARQYELRRYRGSDGTNRFKRIGKTDADKEKVDRDGQRVRMIGDFGFKTNENYSKLILHGCGMPPYLRNLKHEILNL